VFAVNRATDAPTTLRVDLRGVGAVEVVEALTYAHDDVHWRATKEDAETVLPRANGSAALGEDGVLTVELPAVSWSVLRLRGAGA